PGGGRLAGRLLKPNCTVPAAPARKVINHQQEVLVPPCCGVERTGEIYMYFLAHRISAEEEEGTEHRTTEKTPNPWPKPEPTLKREPCRTDRSTEYRLNSIGTALQCNTEALGVEAAYLIRSDSLYLTALDSDDFRQEFAVDPGGGRLAGRLLKPNCTVPAAPGRTETCRVPGSRPELLKFGACGVWSLWSLELVEIGACGVWSLWSLELVEFGALELVEIGACGVWSLWSLELVEFGACGDWSGVWSLWRLELVEFGACGACGACGVWSLELWSLELVEIGACGVWSLEWSCGDWSLWSLELVEIGACGVWSLWSLELVEIGACGVWSFGVELVEFGACGDWSLWSLELVEIGACGVWSLWSLWSLELVEFGACGACGALELVEFGALELWSLELVWSLWRLELVKYRASGDNRRRAPSLLDKERAAAAGAAAGRLARCCRTAICDSKKLRASRTPTSSTGTEVTSALASIHAGIRPSSSLSADAAEAAAAAATAAAATARARPSSARKPRKPIRPSGPAASRSRMAERSVRWVSGVPSCSNRRPTASGGRRGSLTLLMPASVFAAARSSSRRGREGNSASREPRRLTGSDRLASASQRLLAGAGAAVKQKEDEATETPLSQDSDFSSRLASFSANCGQRLMPPPSWRCRRRICASMWSSSPSLSVVEACRQDRPSQRISRRASLAARSVSSLRLLPVPGMSCWKSRLVGGLHPLFASGSRRPPPTLSRKSTQGTRPRVCSRQSLGLLDRLGSGAGDPIQWLRPNLGMRVWLANLQAVVLLNSEGPAGPAGRSQPTDSTVAKEGPAGSAGRSDQSYQTQNTQRPASSAGGSKGTASSEPKGPAKSGRSDEAQRARLERKRAKQRAKRQAKKGAAGAKAAASTMDAEATGVPRQPGGPAGGSSSSSAAALPGAAAAAAEAETTAQQMATANKEVPSGATFAAKAKAKIPGVIIQGRDQDWTTDQLQKVWSAVDSYLIELTVEEGISIGIERMVLRSTFVLIAPSSEEDARQLLQRLPTVSLDADLGGALFLREGQRPKTIPYVVFVPAKSTAAGPDVIRRVLLRLNPDLPASGLVYHRKVRRGETGNSIVLGLSSTWASRYPNGSSFQLGALKLKMRRGKSAKGKATANPGISGKSGAQSKAQGKAQADPKAKAASRPSASSSSATAVTAPAKPREPNLPVGEGVEDEAGSSESELSSATLELTDLRPIETCEDVDHMAETLTGCIIEAYEAACPARAYKGKTSAPWWNPELGKLRRKAKSLHRRAMKTGNPEDMELFRQASRNFKSEVRKAKEFGYADDVTAIVAGPSPSTLRDLMQSFIRKAESWANDNGLELSEPKTVAIMFTSRLRWNIRPLQLYGRDIAFAHQTRCLGVILDHRLNWSSHVKAKAKRASAILAQLRRALGTSWGLSPKRLWWIYTSVVRPAITYASVVWVSATQVKSHADLLNTIQGRACRLICNATRSTPFAGMGAFLNLPPLDLFIRGEAARTTRRLIDAGVKFIYMRAPAKRNLVPHSDLCLNFLNECQANRVFTDGIASTLNLRQRYSVAIDSRDNINDHWNPGELHCYTDGSKQSANTGFGVGIFLNGRVIATHAQYTGVNSSVFQNEVLAISSCTAELLATGVTAWIRTQHRSTWANRTNCRQSRGAVPQPSHQLRKLLLRLSRRDIRAATMTLSGHGCFSRHQYLQGNATNATCSFCNSGDETAEHFAQVHVVHGQQLPAELLGAAAGDQLVADQRVPEAFEFAAVRGVVEPPQPVVQGLSGLLGAQPELVAGEGQVELAGEVLIESLDELVDVIIGVGESGCNGLQVLARCPANVSGVAVVLHAQDILAAGGAQVVLPRHICLARQQQRQGVQPGLVADSVDLQAVNVDARVDLLLQRQQLRLPSGLELFFVEFGHVSASAKSWQRPLIVGLGVFHQHLWLRYHNELVLSTSSQFSTCRPAVAPGCFSVATVPRSFFLSTGALNFSRFGSPRPCCNLSIGLFSSLSPTRMNSRLPPPPPPAPEDGSDGRPMPRSPVGAARSGCWRRTRSPKSKFRPAPSSSGGSRGSGTVRPASRHCGGGGCSSLPAEEPIAGYAHRPLDRIGGLQEEDRAPGRKLTPVLRHGRRDNAACLGLPGDGWKEGVVLQWPSGAPRLGADDVACQLGSPSAQQVAGMDLAVMPAMASRNFSTSPLLLLLLLLLGCTAFAAESRTDIKDASSDGEEVNAEKRAYFDPINYGKKRAYFDPINYGNKRAYFDPINYGKKRAYFDPINYGKKRAYFDPINYGKKRAYFDPINYGKKRAYFDPINYGKKRAYFDPINYGKKRAYFDPINYGKKRAYFDPINYGKKRAYFDPINYGKKRAYFDPINYGKKRAYFDPINYGKKRAYFDPINYGKKRAYFDPINYGKKRAYYQSRGGYFDPINYE
uniref:MMS1_N domain-containing protein n=1 Tax=Macrostomum lignano TaxID=282301 RepID=A0A1I8IE52_9PLAT